MSTLNLTDARALTIRQPWASLIASGAKQVENRTWPVPGTWAHPGPLLIHAGKGVDRAAWDHRDVGRDLYAALGTAEIPHAAVVAVARGVGCHRAGPGCCASPYAQADCWHWVLVGVTALEAPVPATGRLGLWRPDAGLLAAVGEQFGAAAAA